MDRVHGKKILVVSCTTKSKMAKDSLKIVESLKGLKKDVDLKIHYHNEDGLPKVYNQYINKSTLAKHDIVLFAHDDLYIDDLKLKGKLISAVNSGLDIVGLAGCVNPSIMRPALWHKMSERQDWRGFVCHTMQRADAVMMSSYGPTPARCAIVDGLFMAVNLKEAIDKDWKFNEKFNFHHYDIASCIDANQKKLKIGVAPIHVIHESPGLENLHDPVFVESEDKFMEIYG